MTIMFTDIEGSATLMESLGEQRWLELLGWHDGIVRQQTAILGGTVVMGQGDGFMLSIPAIGSAAACAMSVQRSLAPGWAGVKLPVRIGPHVGNAKAEGGDFFGSTVVVAARVANAAAGGEILVSQAVQEGLGGSFPLDGARSLSLKGMVGSHAAFPMIWQLTSRSPHRAELTRSSPGASARLQTCYFGPPTQIALKEIPRTKRADLVNASN